MSSAHTPGAAHLQGAWRPVAADISGSVLDIRELRVARLEIQGLSYRIIDTNETAVDIGELEFGGTQVPGAHPSVDIIGVEGPNAGRRLRALYELDGDLLRVAYDLESELRPEAMSATGDQLLLRITYQRFVQQRLVS